MIELFFWVSIFLVCFTYIGYPVSLKILDIFISKKVKKNDDFLPSVSLIITAHNEESRIEKKLENSINLEYPPEKLQIIVTSDGSTDQTNDIVKKYAPQGVTLLPIFERAGKENAQGEAVQIASGEILVFSDVATILEKKSLRDIVSNFSDSSVGCVSSKDVLLASDGKPSGEGLYVKYEMWLRGIESSVNSLVGLSGSYFAARKEVCKDFSVNMQSDFRTLLNSIKLGLRGVSDSKAIGYYADIADADKEFQRKVRTVIRGLTVFFNHPEFLNIFKYKLFSYQYFCHKLLRWSIPFFLFFAIILNVFLIFSSNYYLGLFLIQILFYVIGIFQIRNIINITGGIFKVPQYFLTVNYSIFIAWFKYFKGERIVLWQPSKR